MTKMLKDFNRIERMIRNNPDKAISSIGTPSQRANYYKVKSARKKSSSGYEKIAVRDEEPGVDRVIFVAGTVAQIRELLVSGVIK